MPKDSKRTNEEGTCLYCGARLHPTPYHAEPGATGYRGQGYFCTMTCGWRFGLAFAGNGRRLTPEAER